MSKAAIKSDRLRALLSSAKPSQTSDYEISDSFSALSPFNQSPRVTQSQESSQLLSLLEKETESFSGFAVMIRTRISSLEARIQTLNSPTQPYEQVFNSFHSRLDRCEESLAGLSSYLHSMQSSHHFSALQSTQTVLNQQIESTLNQIQEIKDSLQVTTPENIQVLPEKIIQVKTEMALKYRNFESQLKALKLDRQRELQLVAECREKELTKKLAKIECRLWEISYPLQTLSPLELHLNKLNEMHLKLGQRTQKLVGEAKQLEGVVEKVTDLQTQINETEPQHVSQEAYSAWKPESSLLVEITPQRKERDSSFALTTHDLKL